MTNEEIVQLIQDGVDVQKYMGILYEQNEAYIGKIVHPFTERAEKDDLMQEAYFALMEAVKGFDTSYECKFMTYAVWRIRKSCMTYIKKYGRTKRIPEYMIARIGQYKALVKKLGSVPDEQTVMKELKLTKNQYDLMMSTIYQQDCVSFDEPLSESDGGTVADLLAGDCDVEEAMIQKDLCENLWKQVEELPDQRKGVIVKRYKENQTQKEIALDEGVSVSRIGQIEKEALNQLREMDRVQELAEVFGYDCSFAYSGCLSAVQNGKSSNVEYIAMRRVELEEKYKRIQERFSLMIEGV